MLVGHGKTRTIYAAQSLKECLSSGLSERFRGSRKVTKYLRLLTYFFQAKQENHFVHTIMLSSAFEQFISVKLFFHKIDIYII